MYCTYLNADDFARFVLEMKYGDLIALANQLLDVIDECGVTSKDKLSTADHLYHWAKDRLAPNVDGKLKKAKP